VTFVEVMPFVLSQLPPPPARVLEVGCGPGGELAHALHAARYEVLAIDPRAPAGPIFRAVTLEQLGEDERFDAAVASRSLHHVHDLGGGLDKLARLAPLLVLDEFAWDRFDERTADWYEGQRRTLVAAGHAQEATPAADWEREHAGLHGYEAMRTELDRRYDERVFAWQPHLYRSLGGVATEALERTLVETGAIAAVGFRYAGTVRGAKTAG
jgi:SAM-dependent methyltransferase